MHSDITSAKSVLPDEFRFSHDYCVFLHDVLADIVVSGEKARIFDVTFRFELPDEAAEFSKRNDNDILQWLESHGRAAKAGDIIFRQVVVALLSDFCHFVFEALRSSSKGKLTVAFTLLRKPLKESLLTFEWLLADRPGFIEAFTQDWPDRLDAVLRNQSTSERLNIIRGAVSRTSHAALFDPAFIEQVRYDRRAEHGLADLFDMAMHLITTFKVIETEPQNFNFVFSNDGARNTQWYHIYWHLPVILNYAIDVIEALIFTFVPRVDTELDITDIRRKVGFFLWASHYSAATTLPSAMQIRREYLDQLSLRCSRCGKGLVFDDDIASSVFDRSRFRCPKCRRMNKLV
jgi:hypothetical protein